MAPRTKMAKACMEMKKLGYSEKAVRVVVTTLLNNGYKWKLIEENEYQILVNAILDSEEQKNKKLELPDTWSEDEYEEVEPLTRRSKRRKQYDNEHQSSSPLNASAWNISNEVENQAPGKKKMAGSTYRCSQDNDIEYAAEDPSKDLVLLPCHPNRTDESDSCHVSEKRIITYERHRRTIFSKELCNLHEDDPALEEKAFDKQQSGGAGFDIPLAVVCPDTGSHVIPKDANSLGNHPHLEENHSEPMNCGQSESINNENDAGVLNLDIASSSRGEVKVCLMVESSLRSVFNVSVLESVLKQVEEHCAKTHQIPQTGFSILGLLKNICECFLAAGTSSMYIEDSKPKNEASSIYVSRNPDPQTTAAEAIDNQPSLFSPFRFQNLFEVPPQITRCIRSTKLHLRHLTIHLNVDVTGCSEMKRNNSELYFPAPSSSTEMTGLKQQCYHFTKDITQGQEGYEISLINEINEVSVPTFKYILKNVKYGTACLRFFLANITKEKCCSSCFGDCLSLENPCNCAGETGNEFAYTATGLLKDRFVDNCRSKNHSVQLCNLQYCQDCPLERSRDRSLSRKCKGHVARQFIKECWYKCGCSMKCGNRVVQRGITAKLQVFMTPDGKGWGLRTLEDVPKGAFICEYVGEVVTNMELFERNVQNAGETHSVVLDAGWTHGRVMKNEEALCLDAKVYGNIARFINHRCSDANLLDIPVEIETPDHHYYHLAFFTTRKVNALEELTWDYGIDFNDPHPAKGFHCLCGSEFCRDRRCVKRTRSVI